MQYLSKRSKRTGNIKSRRPETPKSSEQEFEAELARLSEALKSDKAYTPVKINAFGKGDLVRYTAERFAETGYSRIKAERLATAEELASMSSSEGVPISDLLIRKSHPEAFLTAVEHPNWVMVSEYKIKRNGEPARLRGGNFAKRTYFVRFLDVARHTPELGNE